MTHSTSSLASQRRTYGRPSGPTRFLRARDNLILLLSTEKLYLHVVSKHSLIPILSSLIGMLCLECVEYVSGSIDIPLISKYGPLSKNNRRTRKRFLFSFRIAIAPHLPSHGRRTHALFFLNRERCFAMFFSCHTTQSNNACIAWEGKETIAHREKQ